MDIYYSDRYIFIKDVESINKIINSKMVNNLDEDYIAILNNEISELLAIIKYKETEDKIIIKHIIFINVFNEDIISDFIFRFLDEKSVFIESENQQLGIGDLLQKKHDLTKLITIINT